MNNLTFVQVTKSNYKKAIAIQSRLFPDREAKHDILESVGKTAKSYSFLNYYLIQADNNIVGITGFYAYDIYPNDAWMGWFDILPEYDQSNIEKQSVDFIKEKAKEYGYSTLRVYSDEIADKDMNKVYENAGMTKEEYKNEEGQYFKVGKMLIYSISLDGKPLEKWNNKLLFLASHDERNKQDLENSEDSLDLTKIKLVDVNSSNYTIAIKIQRTECPFQNGSEDIRDSLTGKSKLYDYLKYFLIQYEEKYIGMCGLYSYKEYPSDAWFGWFAILPDYRKKGIEEIQITRMQKLAKDLGFKSVHIYSDSNIFHYINSRFEKYFDLVETYELEEGKYYAAGKTLIFSKSLTNEPTTYWGKKLIYLEKAEKENLKYKLKFEPINEKNLKTAGLVQYTIFKDSYELGYVVYADEVKNRDKPFPIDFLAYYRGKPVGVIGLIEVEPFTDDIWINWFGVLPKYRKHGFGTQMLSFVLGYAKRCGKKKVRLFTYSTWNSKALGIYNRTMQLVEDYSHPEDNQYLIENGKPKIYSIDLTGKKVNKWDNRFIDLNNEGEWHIRSLRKLTRDGVLEDKSIKL